jgi:HSP20 family molecular chaperone IbpA
MMDDFFKPVVFSGQNRMMKTDVKETDGNFELLIDMPGYDKKEINLTLNDGYLTVSARREEKEEDEKNYTRRERSFSCSRSYFVGNAVTEEDVEARYENGTLSLIVPKKDKKELPKKNIEIK